MVAAPKPRQLRGNPLLGSGRRILINDHLRDRSPTPNRHTCITLAIRGGASIAKAQAAARYADPRTTMRYAHDMDDRDDNAFDYVKL